MRAQPESRRANMRADGIRADDKIGFQIGIVPADSTKAAVGTSLFLGSSSGKSPLARVYLCRVPGPKHNGAEKIKFERRMGKSGTLCRSDRCSDHQACRHFQLKEREYK